MKSVTFAVEGMHCDGCARTIQHLVGTEPGVQAVEMSFAERDATVRYDPELTSEDRLVAALETPGYRAMVKSR